MILVLMKNKINPLRQPMKSLGLLAGCWPHVHVCPKTHDHTASTGVTCNQHVSPAQYSWASQPGFAIIAPQILHDAGLAPVPYTGQNCLRKFVSPRGIRTSARPVVRRRGMMPQTTQPWFETDFRDSSGNVGQILRILSLSENNVSIAGYTIQRLLDTGIYHPPLSRIVRLPRMRSSGRWNLLR